MRRAGKAPEQAAETSQGRGNAGLPIQAPVKPRETERYLHEKIPLSKSMQVSVVSVDGTGVLLSAPLAPNLNHRGTVFGGSASALGMIACWTLIHLRLRGLPFETALVIRRNSVEYFAPLPADFEAFARAPRQGELGPLPGGAGGGRQGAPRPDRRHPLPG